MPIVEGNSSDGKATNTRKFGLSNNRDKAAAAVVPGCRINYLLFTDLLPGQSLGAIGRVPAQIPDPSYPACLAKIHLLRDVALSGYWL
jgi:hypothetical protein